MSLFLDLHQQYGIRNASATADAAKSAAQKLQFDVDDLKRKTESLSIACQAMWELLRAQTDMTDEMILQKMQEVDLRDGTLDGKMKAKPVHCPRCGRTTSAARKTCLFCGSDISAGHVFEKV